MRVLPRLCCRWATLPGVLTPLRHAREQGATSVGSAARTQPQLGLALVFLVLPCCKSWATRQRGTRCFSHRDRRRSCWPSRWITRLGSTSHAVGLVQGVPWDARAVWTGPPTGFAAARLEVDGRQVDARRVVLAKHGETLPRHSRLENRCEALCLTYEHIRLKGEDDLLGLGCSCGQRIRVLKAGHRGAYCSGRPGKPHANTVMTVNGHRLDTSVRAA